jgi:hypothetical protein
MLWRYTDETIEAADGVLHRPNCDEVAVVAHRHPAGSSMARDVAPQECWVCRPELEVVLGV